MIVTVASTRIYSVEPTALGLAGSLPLVYWIGLGSLGALWVFSTHTKWILALALILTVGFLFFAPAVIREPVWLSNSYYPFGESALVSSSGHFLARPGQTLNSYHNWPLFIYFSSVFVQLTGVSVTPLLKFFPIFIILLCGLLAYLILRIRLSIPLAALGVGIFFASFWFRQQYFGPPGFGFVLFLLNLLIVLKYFFSEMRNKTALAGLFLIVFLATVFTHVLSAFMSMAALVALSIAQRFARKKPILSVSPFVLSLYAIVVFLAYNMFFTPGFFSWAVDVFYGVVSLDRELGVFKESSRISGSAAQLLNYRSTLAIIGLNCGLAFVGLLSILREKISRRKFFSDGFNIFWLLLVVFLGIFAVSFEYGPHEAYQRALMFGLVPLAYFVVFALRKKPKLLVVVIIALFVLNIPAQYGGDSYTLETKTDLSGAHFFSLSTPNNISCLYDFSLLQRYFDPAKNVTFKIVETLPFTSMPNASTVMNVASQCDYVILSDTQDSYYYYFLQQNPIAETLGYSKSGNVSFSRLYDSKGFVILGKG